MTTVYVDPILAASMLALGKLVSPGPGKWSASSPEQEEFLGKLGALTETIAMLPDYFYAAAAKSAGPVNAFLASHGFAGNLREAGPRSLYAAAVLDLLVEWVTPGSAVQLALHDGRLAPGVRLKKGHFRVDGRVLLPPQPGAATVVTLDDGRTLVVGKQRPAEAQEPADGVFLPLGVAIHALGVLNGKLVCSGHDCVPFSSGRASFLPPPFGLSLLRAHSGKLSPQAVSRVSATLPMP